MEAFDYGFELPNGVRIVHGEGAFGKDAFPPEVDIPGRLYEFSPGHASDCTTPAFRGAQGCFEFDVDVRMPRHVHFASTAGGNRRFVVEKIFVPYGVGLAELGGELYVIPPRTLILIAEGVPHTWTACPAGLNVTRALGLKEKDQDIVSDGRFMAVYEYEEPTAFFPTSQTHALRDPSEYVRCEDLESIRIAKLNVEQVMQKASFVWGRGVRKLAAQQS